MLSEDLDKKIRDAAQHHHPSYDGKAWSGMKKLLDKHMPEEKEDRRRFFFILFFILLLGGGAWWIVGRGSSDKEKEKPVASVRQPAADNTTTETVKDNSTVQIEPAKKVSGEDNKEEPPATGNLNADKTAPTGPGIDPIKNKIEHTVAVVPDRTSTVKSKKDRTAMNGTGSKPTKNSTPSVQKTAGSAPVSKTDVTNKDVVPLAKSTDTDLTKGNPVSVTDTKKEAVKTVNDDKKTADPVASAVPPNKAEDKKPEEKVAAKRDKSPAKKKSFFFISASAGPDFSFTGSDKPGKTKLLGGAGIGYSYKDKFTLRTGFYSSRKIYTASPDEYHAPDWFAIYYPNMQKIEADCKVYEIPLLLSYNIMNKEKQNIFASTGLSTYLMKRETYNYYYKYYPTGPTVNRGYTTVNKNNHYFSVLNLSAGYQRNFGKKFSLTAEPYFKLPLKGVGEGKVKLNSGGVLFTVSFKPFISVEKNKASIERATQ